MLEHFIIKNPLNTNIYQEKKRINDDINLVFNYKNYIHRSYSELTRIFQICRLKNINQIISSATMLINFL